MAPNGRVADSLDEAKATFRAGRGDAPGESALGKADENARGEYFG